MKKLTVKLENCYGISKFGEEFDFTNDRTYVIYAPNGVMKTSFAKTFKNISDGEAPCDLAFPERESKCLIVDENATPLKPESIFVIEPYNESFKSDKLSTLLVSKTLKDEYDKEHSTLELEKNAFVKKLKKASSSSDCEQEIMNTFARDRKNFYEVIANLCKDLDGKKERFDFKYNDVFDKKGKVKEFLEKNSDSLDLYIEKYESLITSSKFFKKSKNTFGTYQAGLIGKSISDNAFFDAGHAIELGDDRSITSYQEYNKIVQSEIDNILSDQNLKSIFERINKALDSSLELRNFKNVIEENNLLLLELKDYEEFKRKVWLGHLDALKDDVGTLIDSYEMKREVLGNILRRASEEKTLWEKAINEYNIRFKNLPFRLLLENKEDVLLKTQRPDVKFVFKDVDGERPIEKESLLKILSQGERRALYLLNIIFEIQARKVANTETLFIIDDIADSFDYKNKYAIIEYLKDISEINQFYQIILTHNYDFYRSISGRVIGNFRQYKLVAYKKDRDVKLMVEKYQKNPLLDWKKHLDRKVILVASLPFVRNLAEYIGLDDEYKKLSDILHVKPDTMNYSIKDLEDTIKLVLVGNTSLHIPDPTDTVVSTIFTVAETILKDEAECMDLEYKVALSVAIRLRAEMFIISKITDTVFLEEVYNSTYQTVKLIDRYRLDYPDDEMTTKLLEEVNLMTPENIHLNSFMYEPIIDLGDKHLRELYKNVSNLS